MERGERRDRRAGEVCEHGEDPGHGVRAGADRRGGVREFLGPRPAPMFATAAGLSAGLCWVAGSFGINYLFEQRPLRLFLINGGYHTVQYTVIGAVLGLWQ